MALIVLHCHGNGHEGTLDQDVARMGNHYGDVIHVTQNQNMNYAFPNPKEEPVFHILAHGGKDKVADISAGTFKQWMVKAFQMSSNKGLQQTYFIYSCDITTGGDNLLSSIAQHVASLQIRNRTFIGTAGENGVIKNGQGIGKVLVQAPGKDQQQNLGLGWKGYRTVTLHRKETYVIARKLSHQEVNTIVLNTMNW
jgi:hypothetical protein